MVFFFGMYFYFNGAIPVLLAPYQIERMMEEKYHGKFEFVQWYRPLVGGSDRIALLKPMYDPNRVVQVDMYQGILPWEVEYVDHTYSDAVRDYLKEKAKEIGVSRYASTIYTDVNVCCMLTRCT